MEVSKVSCFTKKKKKTKTQQNNHLNDDRRNMRLNEGEGGKGKATCQDRLKNGIMEVPRGDGKHLPTKRKVAGPRQKEIELIDGLSVVERAHEEGARM